MIYENMNTEALNIISDVRNRYDGYKRNPFNEEECGNHYARAMASWSALLPSAVSIIRLLKKNLQSHRSREIISGPMDIAGEM